MRYLVSLLLLLALSAALVPAQRPEPDRSPEPPGLSRSKLLKHQHEEVRKMSARLVELATEIEEDLEKQGENVLPLTTLKKLEEIEKLARRMRDRIKQ